MKLPAALTALFRRRRARAHRAPWAVRLAVAVLIVVAAGVVLVSNRWLSDRFTETTRNKAELSLALYSGNLQSELQRTSVVPLLLARDPEINEALKDHDFSATSQRLIQVQQEIGVAQILLLDKDGRTVAATNRNLLGTSYRHADPFVLALRAMDTIFAATRHDGGGFDFTYSRVITSDGQGIGVIVVSADLMKFERAWARLQDRVLVTDSAGAVLLATETRWRGEKIEDVLAARARPRRWTGRFPPRRTGRRIRPTPTWPAPPSCAPRCGCRSAAGTSSRSPPMIRSANG